MRNTGGPEVLTAELWRESERRRLVRLCAAVTGDRDAAEDLAQETLLEAWRNAHKLRDPEGADRWLSAIARNVCLRWARRQGRDASASASIEAGLGVADALDVEADLEREELVRLLDRALALLPPAAREVLVERYVHGASHAEIAARLGLSEDAVAMRVSRGKAVLRALLASELRDEAEAYGLVDTSSGGWRPTKVWCAECGRCTLVMRKEERHGVVAFRCPACNPDAVGTAYRLENPFFARLVGELVRPTAILARAADWSRRYFAPGAAAAVACTGCGHVLQLRRYFRDREGRRRDGLYADCERCGEQVSSSVGGLAQSLPEVRELRRRRSRTRALPQRRVELGGRAALLVRYEDLLGSTGVNGFFDDETLRVLEVSTN